VSVVVRPGTADDAALLHRIAAATFPLACPPETPAANIAQFIAEHLSEQSFTGYLADRERDIFLAEWHGVAVGYTMLVSQDPDDADVLAVITRRPVTELSKCYVLANAHGAGVAGALVEASVRAASARGAVAVWLGVNQQNARANRFYEKNGFRLVGTKTFHVGERVENDFVRELVLAPR
jgi:ribosomal protein S18 acetylase RimI-like enzyme